MENYEPKIGDTVTPIDGSGMPFPLHEYLHHAGGFRDVKILDIQGYMMAVHPIGLSWLNIPEDGNLRRCRVWLGLEDVAEEKYGIWMRWRFSCNSGCIAVQPKAAPSRFSNVRG